MKQISILIYGPTGVGKTEFVEKLGQDMPIEVINMDMGQLYEPYSIGTAKPQWKTHTLPHHMFDEVKTPEDFDVTRYRNRAIEVVDKINQKNHIPVFVGGSGFYLKSLLFPPLSLSAFDKDNKLDFGDLPLWKQLEQIDPERAAQIHPQDEYRLKRALAIWLKTGKKPSEQKPTYKPFGPYILIFLYRDRQDLYQRINNRVLDMLEQGWMKEIEAIRGTEWEKYAKSKKLIGYPQLLETIEVTPKIIDAIQTLTRQYAKRQIAFWKMLKREIAKEDSSAQMYEFNLTIQSVDLYIKQLKNILFDRQSRNE